MKNLKPFDLQAALSGKAVMLRDGRKAYVRHHETELPVRFDRVLSGFIGMDSCQWCVNGSSARPGVNYQNDIIGMYPETRVINGFEVPAPESKGLEEGCTYFLALPHTESLFIRHVWSHCNKDRLWLKRGLVFVNKKDAIATAKAMLGIDPHEGDES